MPVGLDGIKTFNTIIKDNNIHIEFDENFNFEDYYESNKLVKRDLSKDKRTFVIVGSGPTGLQCALSLRENGFYGNILIVSEESSLPIDRTMLSKNLTGVNLDS